MVPMVSSSITLGLRTFLAELFCRILESFLNESLFHAMGMDGGICYLWLMIKKIIIHTLDTTTNADSTAT